MYLTIHDMTVASGYMVADSVDIVSARRPRPRRRSCLRCRDQGCRPGAASALKDRARGEGQALKVSINDNCIVSVQVVGTNSNRARALTTGEWIMTWARSSIYLCYASSWTRTMLSTRMASTISRAWWSITCRAISVWWLWAASKMSVTWIPLACCYTAALRSTPILTAGDALLTVMGTLFAVTTTTSPVTLSSCNPHFLVHITPASYPQETHSVLTNTSAYSVSIHPIYYMYPPSA